jgi:hypothetical protein
VCDRRVNAEEMTGTVDTSPTLFALQQSTAT